jgi:hypothetical protein
VAAGPGDKVEEGIARFREGKLEEAWKLFSDADVSMPENRRIAFNRAAVRHAQGDAEAARPLYVKAISVKDPELTARTHYNLGTLEAERARALFGEKPADVPPEKRQEGVAGLQQAVRHYRSCLELEPTHKDARHNLELIRLWLKHMADVWAKKDREKQREELDLLSFVELLIDEERRLQDSVVSLAREADSPRRREAIRQLASAQRKLGEEIDPLKKKISETLKAPQAQGSDDEQRKRFEETLHGWADDAGKAMAKAADDANGTLLDESRGFQAEALDALYRIWSTVAPFERTLQRSIQLEEGVVEGTSPLANEKELPDLFPLVRDQERVNALAGLLPAKAEQGRKQLEAPPSPAPEGDDKQKEEQKKLKEGLKQAFEKAIELAPKVEALAGEAAKHLGEKMPKDALPKEEEALKLLKEIAKSFPQSGQPETKDDPKKQDDSQKPEQDQAQKPPQSDPRQQLSRERAEALLQKARERERDYQDKKRELLRGAAGRTSVDRDW